MFRLILGVMTAAWWASCLGSDVGAGGPVTQGAYRGACDASAAAAVSASLFVAASDEENLLRVYRFEGTETPVQTVALGGFLGEERKRGEADIEGAARVADRVYWITSHSRSKEGKERPGRKRLFATSIVGEGDQVRLQVTGQPYTRLLEDLVQDPRLAASALAKAAAKAPEEPGGLNIEGLSAWRDGGLLIGFRSPVPKGRALLVPFLNPGEVMDRGARARFGKPLLLDMHGRGVRDLLWEGGTLYIVAGGAGAGGRSRLYRWPGTGHEPKWMREAEFEHFNPEALVFRETSEGRRLVVLSDDGNRLVAGMRCADLPDPGLRSFRWLSLALPEGAGGHGDEGAAIR